MILYRGLSKWNRVSTKVLYKGSKGVGMRAYRAEYAGLNKYKVGSLRAP